MKQNRHIFARWILCILYAVLGVSLIVCGLLNVVDEFWSGMGTALLIVSALQIFRLVRYNTNAKYKEDTDTAVNDERNRFIRNKAWAWAGYVYIVIAAIATIVFKLIDQEVLMFAASGSVCIILILYWIVYLILRKKY